MYEPEVTAGGPCGARLEASGLQEALAALELATAELEAAAGRAAARGATAA